MCKRSYPSNHTLSAWTRCALLLLFALGSTASAVTLANSELRGLRSYTIDGVLRLKDDEIDLATAALILSREWGTPRTAHVYRRKIDDMAEHILKKLGEKHIPTDYRAIPVINEYLFEEMGFSSVKTADDPEDLFLHVVLDKKRGYCLSLSVLYLSIAERLGLPMYGVVVPGHFFVRYDDGQQRYNVETTAKGAIVPDEHYVEEFAPPTNPKTLYMKNLTKKETLACFFNNLGNSYEEVGNLDKALNYLLLAVKIAPNLSEGNLNLGNVYLQKKMPREAIKYYEKALAILSDDAKVLNMLAAAYMQLKDWRQAEEFLRNAITLDPAYVDAYRNLAAVLYYEGQREQALGYLKTAIQLEPDNASCCLLAGRICKDLKTYPQALEYLKKAVTIDPSGPEPYVSLGDVYYDQGMMGEAKEYYLKALSIDDNQPRTYFSLAQVYHLLDKTDREISAYKKALYYDPSMVPALQNLGNAYSAQGSEELAVDAYTKAIELDANSPDLHYNLGVTYEKMKKHEAAVQEFSKAIELDKENGGVYYNAMAISYYEMGNRDLAKSYAQKAQQLGFNVQEALLK